MNWYRLTCLTNKTITKINNYIYLSKKADSNIAVEKLTDVKNVIVMLLDHYNFVRKENERLEAKIEELNQILIDDRVNWDIRTALADRDRYRKQCVELLEKNRNLERLLQSRK